MDESYLEHFLFAVKLSALLFAAAIAALIHAVLPFLFEKTASTIIRRISSRIDRRSDPAGVPVPVD